MQAALDVLKSALDAAQNELTGAEIGLLEATARASKAREEAERLKAAVAALTGESRPVAAPEKRIQVAENGNPDAPIPKKTETADEAAEIDAWERERAAKMAAKAKREKEERANDPLAQLKCTGCGVAGQMALTMKQAPSGVPIRMLLCGGCGNMLMA